jgi:integrase
MLLDGVAYRCQRGEDRWRLRYWANGERHTKTVRGTKNDAKDALRSLLESAAKGIHVAPSRMTLAQWINQWLTLLQRPDGSRRLIGRRSWERYEQLCRVHILPTLGSRPLQQITPTEIDALYVLLEKTLAPRTVRYVHATMTTCLNAAVRKGALVSNPASRADAPMLGNADAGQALDQAQLTRLLAGFRALPLYPIVAVAAFTGARRGEILALRWADFDPVRKTLSITRAVEQSRQGRRVKEPKTARGIRTITIDDGLVEMLARLRDQYLRLVAGVGPDDPVDLSPVKLPEGALIFPSPRMPFDLTRLRSVNAVTHQFVQHANQLGFADLRFHDLRGTHETMQLDAGVPVHVVAARCGHDPAVLLHIYAKRTKKADTSAAAIIGAMSRAMLAP